jgi:exosortase/archaeosortase family protein
VIFLSVMSLPGIMPSISGKLFCLPVARASSFFLGSPSEVQKDGSYLIEAGGLPVSVSESCNAFNYFVLLYTLLMGTCVYYLPIPRAMLNAFPLLLLSYAVSVAANTARVIASVYVYKIGAAFLPGNYERALHMSVGIAIFLTVTLISFIFFERRFSGGNR